MPKRATELKALDVGRLKDDDGMHFVGGVAGLALSINGPAKSWLFRYSLAGRRPEMGLGSFPEVGVAEARERAAKARALINQGIDPIRAARAAKSANLAAQARMKTFTECAEAFIADKSPEWSNVKHAGQWASTLQTYVYPAIGKLYVQDVTDAHVIAVLRPIWKTKNETATRVMNRIGSVLDWASVHGFRPKELPNPAKWTGNLEHVFAAPSKVSKVVHHRSLPYDQVPAFVARLNEAEGQGARALLFAIITAARSGEVRGAVWSEVDFGRRLWTVPADRMKMDREHRVPLSAAAVRLLKAQPRVEGVDLVFPSATGKPISDMTLTAVTRRMKVDAVPHGFRASFRTWAAEETSGYPAEVVEAALAHSKGDKVLEAYQRGDLFEKRRGLMDEWAAFLATAEEGKAARKRQK